MGNPGAALGPSSYGGRYPIVKPPQGMKQFTLRCKLRDHPPFGWRTAIIGSISQVAYAQVVLHENDFNLLSMCYESVIRKYHEE